MENRQVAHHPFSVKSSLLLESPILFSLANLLLFVLSGKIKFVNLWFSYGDAKKHCLIQMNLFKPQVYILWICYYLNIQTEKNLNLNFASSKDEVSVETTQRIQQLVVESMVSHKNYYFLHYFPSSWIDYDLLYLFLFKRFNTEWIININLWKVKLNLDIIIFVFVYASYLWPFADRRAHDVYLTLH